MQLIVQSSCLSFLINIKRIAKEIKNITWSKSN